uniref:Uncharacterized protein n=1 Tax=Meloidogyne enterolobii TaxID=390850 RepID=A0A6V7V2F2_MELEN|nr:unnamed protein product [Meloidogyne enterolobii]
MWDDKRANNKLNYNTKITKSQNLEITMCRRREWDRRRRSVTSPASMIRID